MKANLADFLTCPGALIQEIDQMLHKQLCSFSKKGELRFFGCHPQSLAKSDLNQIFKVKYQQNDENVSSGIAPCQYNACEKTDGVRYILIITDVGDCYFMSRKLKASTDLRPVFYKVNIPFAVSSSKLHKLANFSKIYQILDGELVIDEVEGSERLKFYVFDTIVHLGRDVRRIDLVRRINFAKEFIEDNHKNSKIKKESQLQPAIEVILKDFFDLDDPKQNKLEYLFNIYIKGLSHKNDGIIFNKKWQSHYGWSGSCFKWKPPHLNTIDFLVVLNKQYQNQHKSSNTQLVDLYLYDSKLVKFDIMIVSQAQFNNLVQIQNEMNKEKSEDIIGIVAECNYIQTPAEFQLAYNELKKERSKSWNILKIRKDKSVSNAVTTAEKIMKTIKDNITEGTLISTWKCQWKDKKKPNQRTSEQKKIYKLKQT